MPLRGGPSDKTGNTYEAMWTIVCMARVMRGQCDSIRLEPPGSEGRGVEFWLGSGDSREYHQVKRQGARRGRWTLRELDRAGVLPAFRDHLAKGGATCVFVSMQGADDLRELAERARDAADHEEFERAFAKLEWGEKLTELRKCWSGCTDDEVFERLKRIRVHTIDEETLEQHAEMALTPLVEGKASVASAVLFKYALKSIHRELGSSQIRAHLSEKDLRPPPWAELQALSDVVDAANERYLSLLVGELIRSKLIERDESGRVLSALLEGATRRGVIMTGGAGFGKSTILLEVIKGLQRQGVPVLAFRIDRLEPTQRPDEAGRQLRLPASPVVTLAGHAKGRPCVLVLDQLDAVSLMSGRNPSFFDCFDEMVRQALTQPNMRLLVACRQFDFENDPRLRRLGGRDDVFEEVKVGALSDKTVRDTAEAMGLDTARLSDQQIRLLTVPAHLKLLTEVAGEGEAIALEFRTANDLYDRYWSRKQALLRGRIGRPVAWTDVIDTLCDHMSKHQILSAPMALLDAHALDAQVMASEHVLVLDGKRIAFFHEGFFDYAFARRFAARGGDLVGLLRPGEQHLFRRTQVRQILLHEREADQQRYLADLETLLSSPDIRFHIKQVVFALLTEYPDPTEEEWRILEALLQDPDYAHSVDIWRTVRTLPWFRFLDSLGVVANWLSDSNSDTVDQAMMLLNSVRDDEADRVATLVEPYIGASEEWRNRLRNLVRWAHLNVGRRFFDLFLGLLDRGDLDGMGMSREDDFLSLLYDLAKQREDWTCEAIRHFLDRRIELALAGGGTNPFSERKGLDHSHSSDHVLIGSAQRAPEAFMEHVLPAVLRVVELNADREGAPPWYDAVWRYRQRDGGHSVADHLLHAAEEALRSLAKRAPDEFCRSAEALRTSEYDTVQFLLIRAYAANGKRFADEAIDHICGSSSRLRCGYLDTGSSGRASSDLLVAVTPFCSVGRLAKLEAAILAYYPRRERTAGGHESRGWAQFKLLLAIDQARRSVQVNARIEEWQRKFRVDAPPEPSPLEISRVESPIPTAAAERMTDDQWLNALSRYASDDERARRDGTLTGGAYQLSHVLEAQARKEPTRFAKLAPRIPDDANPAYFAALLRGLNTGATDQEALFEACRRCYRLADRAAGSAFCDLVEKLPELPWPDDLLDAVTWHATEDPDPNREMWRTEAWSGQCYYRGDIYLAGINCVRGSAAGAVRALLFADRERMQRLLPTVERMVRDPSIAVRSCVVTALLPLLNHDRDRAVQLFLELCDTEDVLLRTHHVEEFIGYATRTHSEQVLPIVERMLCSSDPEVAQAGARRACVASFDTESAAELAERCLSGEEPLRIGAAQVAARNVSDLQCRSACQALLIQLFDDPSEAVRASATNCFDHLKDDALGQLRVLVERFRGSVAFDLHHESLVRALEETTARLPHVTISVCERFIEIAGPIAGDFRTRAAYDADCLSKLLVRAYHQAPDAGVRKRCLDTIDSLLAVRAYGMTQILGQVER